MTTDGSAEITQEEAVKSLGSKASKYVVKTWAKEAKEEPKES